VGPRRGTAIAGALLALLAVAGCGLGAGEGLEPVHLKVSRDYGREVVLERQVGGVTEADTVMRVLEGEAEVGTRYGGGFVQSIDGLEAAREGGRAYDWFFFVDGVESPIGAAEYSLRGGERIWWDHRDWTAASRVPAVVGSWPAPFLGGYEGERHPVAVECEGAGGACVVVRESLEAAGVAVAAGTPKGALRVLVGPWARLRSDPAAALIESGVQESGVSAEFVSRGAGYRLVGLDEGGAAVREFGSGAGLVAATRRYEGPPVWVVTGPTAAGVAAAAGLLNAADLRDHYAVATEDGKETPLPLEGTR
jgi:Domain of unknown function (DUF4430)